MATFREMTAADIPDVFAVRLSTTENAVTKERLDELGITTRSIAEAMQQDAKGFVCEIGETIAGFVMGDRSTGEVTALAVHPDYEQQGIGKQLLKLIVDWLVSFGHEELWLLTGADTSFRAYDFYRSQGWQPTGEFTETNDEKFILPLRRSANANAT